MSTIPKLIKDTEKYFQYEGSANPTTQDELQAYMKNEHSVVECLTDALWQPETVYTIGHIVKSPNMPKGFQAVCLVNGTSSSNEPDWGSGATDITDGSTKWKVTTANITVNGISPDASGNISITSVDVANELASTLPIANGGTGANNAEKARENLGLATVASTGSYNDLSNKPTIPSAYNFPTASASVLGGIKVGSGLSISSGVLSVSGRGNAYKIPYGTSSTSSNTGAKVATISNEVSFSLQAGVVVVVKFTDKYGIGRISTLNVNSTGAKTVSVYYSNNNGNDTPNSIRQNNNVYLFVYDGSNWNTVSACTV